MPNQKYLLDKFRYDKKTGKLFYRNTNKYRPDLQNKEAGYTQMRNDCATPIRYRKVEINNRTMSAHRIIWTMIYGDIEDGLEIDHIDHDGLNNRLDNLRLVSHKENTRNRSMNCNNRTGYAGVSYDKRNKKFVSQLASKFLGYFDTAAEASTEYNNAKRKSNYHRNHGK